MTDVTNTTNKPISISNQAIFPHLHLLVSGGNSQLLLLKSFSDWKIIGQTLDDAAGECFDKIGRMVGFQYPAGVSVARTAKLDDNNYLNLSVGMQRDGGYNYSFSGLKTAVRYMIQKSTIPGIKFEKALVSQEITELMQITNASDLENLNNPNKQKLEFIYQICCSVQAVVIKQLLNKFEKALKNNLLENKIQSIGLSGGVSANLLLRQSLKELGDKYQIQYLFKPHLKLTGDNAIMIGLAGLAGLYEENQNKS